MYDILGLSTPLIILWPSHEKTLHKPTCLKQPKTSLSELVDSVSGKSKALGLVNQTYEPMHSHEQLGNHIGNLMISLIPCALVPPHAELRQVDRISLGRPFSR